MYKKQHFGAILPHTWKWECTVGSLGTRTFTAPDRLQASSRKGAGLGNWGSEGRKETVPHVPHSSVTEEYCGLCELGSTPRKNSDSEGRLQPCVYSRQGSLCSEPLLILNAQVEPAVG